MKKQQLITLDKSRCEGIAADMEAAALELRRSQSNNLSRRQALAAFLDLHAGLLRRTIDEQAAA